MKKLLLVLLAIPSILFADRLTISNETDVQLYAAVYYVPYFGKINRASEIVSMPPGANVKLDRPGQKIGSDRELLVVPAIAQLPSTFTKSSLKAVGSKPDTARINVGQLQGKRFYIGVEKDLLRFYTIGQWEQRGKDGVIAAAKAKRATLLAATKAQFSRAYNAVVPDVVTEQVKKTVLAGVRSYWVSPYEKQVAQVRTGNGISSEERAVLGKRMQKTRVAMEAKLGKISRPPKIAVVASGGGYRAMIFTIGFLVGAQKTGLLDMTTWMSALSGSTWAMGTWLQNNAQKGRVAPDQFRSQFFPMIHDKGLETDLGTSNLKYINNLLLTGGVFGKPFTLVNLYGALLANRLFKNFGEKRQTLRLSDQQSLINTGDFPVPIYTAVSGEKGQPEYYWYAFTPWEVSMEPWTKGGTGISVPTWGYGRKFRNGTSTGYMPEQSLGFQFATFGSAFAADVQTIYENMNVESDFTNKIIKKIIDVSKTSDTRLTWAAVPNFGRGIAASPLRANDGLQLVDAGLAFNLPYPPVSGMRAERTPDIIIFVDASADIKGVGEFKKVEKYARQKGLKFPPIDYTMAEKKGVSIHVDSKDPSVPVVIYVPRINDVNQTVLLNKPNMQQYKADLTGFDVEKCTQKEACNTFNFKYSVDDTKKLSMLGEFNLMAYQDEIFAVIKQRAGIVN